MGDGVSLADHVANMRHSRTYGGNVELASLSAMYNVNLEQSDTGYQKRPDATWVRVDAKGTVEFAYVPAPISDVYFQTHYDAVVEMGDSPILEIGALVGEIEDAAITRATSECVANLRTAAEVAAAAVEAEAEAVRNAVAEVVAAEAAAAVAKKKMERGSDEEEESDDGMVLPTPTISNEGNNYSIQSPSENMWGEWQVLHEQGAVGRGQWLEPSVRQNPDFANQVCNRMNSVEAVFMSSERFFICIIKLLCFYHRHDHFSNATLALAQGCRD